jgi:two-component system, chemotaxis family, response regulator Rcp1
MPKKEENNNEESVKQVRMPPDMLTQVDPAYATRLNLPRYVVFLVEDNADDRFQTTRVLKGSPYIKHIQSFTTADQLKQHLVEQGYFKEGVKHPETLVLMDVYLPGTTGIELLSEMKLHPATANIPIIIVTGDTSKEVVNAAHNLKANAYITKPVKLEDVHEVMDTGSGWPEDHPEKQEK